MNKIIREDYPVSRLPDDLRLEAAPATHVRLTMEQLPIETEQPGRQSLASGRIKAKSRIESLGINIEAIKPVSLRDIHSIAKLGKTTPKQAVQRIRRLRAERNDR